MIPKSVRILVCTEPQDMRRSFDALALTAQQALGEDPRSGALFCFVNKRANRIKVLWWEKTGYCLLYKRMHRAVVAMPTCNDGTKTIRIDGTQLAKMVAGVVRQTEKNP